MTFTATSQIAQIAVSLRLTREMSTIRTVDEIYTIALDALSEDLGVVRAGILLFDADGVMRFKAWRHVSDSYRACVEGHTPWQPDSPDPQALLVPDISHEPSIAAFVPTIQAEGIAAMAFIPLISLGRVIGTFMLYYDEPHTLAPDELQLAMLIASQVAFAVERTRAEEQARRSEERLRFALEAASMGTWVWDLASRRVRWSDNLEMLHGLPSGTFERSFSAQEQEIHPEDREQVQTAIQRALDRGVPYDVEYRIVAPDGRVRWVEEKGRVEYESGKPVRMTGVCMIVTRRKEAELQRLASAEEASRLKDEFLATLSHEMRTPLNAILGWGRLLQAGDVSSERLQHAIDIIIRNANLQAQLIEDILDVSRIITGKLEIDRLPVLVPKLMETVVGGALPAAQTKGVEIIRTVPQGLPPIDGDPKRLHQVLGNVISNAIKFTPAGGRVEIRCGIDVDTIVIEVQDSGIGIAPEFLPFVFDRFRQADSRSTRKHGGLGLGLAIARYLLEQHHGEIHAHSDGTGRGTTIEIRLPVRPHLRARMIRPASTTYEPDVELRMDGATVVVVDDQPDARELLRAIFEQCGGHVVECESAESALDVLRRSAVQLVVADIAMPDVDGYELIRRIRLSYPTMPAVAVSAYARPQDRRQALAAGYNEYCAKPIETAQFLQTVREVIVTV